MAYSRVVMIKPFQKEVQVMSSDNVFEKYGINKDELERLVETGDGFVTSEGKTIYFDEVLMPSGE